MPECGLKSHSFAKDRKLTESVASGFGLRVDIMALDTYR